MEVQTSDSYNANGSDLSFGRMNRGGTRGSAWIPEGVMTGISGNADMVFENIFKRMPQNHHGILMETLEFWSIVVSCRGLLHRQKKAARLKEGRFTE